MRKWISIITAIIILLSLVGCSSKGKIVVENGEYYLVLNTKGSKASDDSSSSGNEVAYFINFSSLSELKNDFETMNFTEEEFETINKMAGGGRKVRIPDLSKLYEPVVPNGHSLKHIGWGGLDTIFFYYYYDNNTREDVWWCCPLTVTKYEDKLKDWERLYGLEILSQEREEERNATVYHLEGRPNKIILYSIVDGDKTIRVREEYLSSGDPNVPYEVSLLVNDNGLCYLAQLTKLMERPSVECLSSFGVKEYVETTTQ